MKWSNDIIVFDLEATSSKSSRGYQRNNYIIDIGAVRLDRNLEIVDSFESLVKPEEPISDFIEDLTGISNEDVSDASLFPEVIKKFEQWVTVDGGNIKKVRLAAWGNYFDIPLLRKMYESYGLRYPFSGSAIDLKSVAMTWLSLAGHRTDKASIHAVCQKMGIIPEGRFHRALVDARCSAVIFKKALNQISGGVFIPVGSKSEYLEVRRSHV